ncbi:MAG TPA: TPM domain-containing protein [Bacteriovoracaceae bacterium]|nr:TPM domain-containing protein [Bacteriovoracaceae bacterium]
MRSLPFFFLTLLACWSFLTHAQEVVVPPLDSPVMDQGKFFSPEESADLGQLAQAIYRNQGPQITVLTLADLQGYPIEEFSIRVAEKWKLGTKEKGNGLLIILSKAERTIRIEVGEGIEGEITDHESKEYIDNILTPAFRQGAFHTGVRAVMEDVARQFGMSGSSENVEHVRRAPVRASNGLLNKIFPIMLGILVFGHLLLRRKPFARGLFSGAGMAGASFFMFPGVGLVFAGILFFVGFFLGLIGISNFLFALLAGGGRGRGGFGGGGFGGGGGGWGGGGGGFSGGGSSGSW